MLKRKISMRKAIAMIELIFAIVIMGIALLSAPQLVSQANKSGYIAFQQESIAAAASQMGLILTRAWDEADENQSRSSILTTTYAHANNDVLRRGAAYRPGMDINASRIHLHFTNGIVTPASNTLGADGGDLDDIDDFNGNNYTLAVYLEGTANTEATTTAQGDYLDDNISILTTVAYGDDVPRGVAGVASADTYTSTTVTFSNPFNNAAVAGTSNIKLITVRLTTNADNELSKDISLSAFSTNIGSFLPNNQDY